MQPAVARPAGKSVGAALGGVLVTLVVFVVVFVAFLVAPLLALLVAFLAYTALRGRDSRPGSTGPDEQPRAAHGFGAGTR